ncbi:MAG: hypothetical protein RQ731_08545 [Anaerosomatales bacterium]|nr:hypothetical protein [Coriobacteriia bacterium]MDF1543207.1 hypothetical protein [Anaerosomatales bacterium]MDT8434787.1 hypothetical protein [Anaerosomatales bacterium]
MKVVKALGLGLHLDAEVLAEVERIVEAAVDSGVEVLVRVLTSQSVMSRWASGACA